MLEADERLVWLEPDEQRGREGGVRLESVQGLEGQRGVWTVF